MGNIITVSREFGSGGRELGKRLADELGYRYYDREIVMALSEQTGMDPNFLDRQLENSSARVRYPIHFAQSFSQMAAVSDTAMHILSLETKLIRELATKDDCIFVGRAADALLEEQKPFKLFVYADEASKLARCRSRACKAAGCAREPPFYERLPRRAKLLYRKPGRDRPSLRIYDRGSRKHPGTDPRSGGILPPLAYRQRGMIVDR